MKKFTMIALSLTLAATLAACSTSKESPSPSEAAETVEDAANAVADTASDAVESAGDAVEAAGDAVVDAAGEVASDVQAAVETSAEVTEEAKPADFSEEMQNFIPSDMQLESITKVEVPAGESLTFILQGDAEALKAFYLEKVAEFEVTEVAQNEQDNAWTYMGTTKAGKSIVLTVSTDKGQTFGSATIAEAEAQ